jgi:hypothetical protein
MLLVINRRKAVRESKKGRGRPVVYPDDRMTTIRLAPADRQVLEDIGQGNVSEGIRRLAEKYRQALARVEEKNNG